MYVCNPYDSIVRGQGDVRLEPFSSKKENIEGFCVLIESVVNN